MHPSPFVFAASPRSNKRCFEREDTELYSLRLDVNSEKFGRRHFIDLDMSFRSVIAEPHKNDVLMGRGGKNNQHSGNEKLRQLARLECENYKISTKKGKSAISRQLVKQMRELDPPARFLKKLSESGVWEEVGDDTAREKASQVLRDAVAAQSEDSSAVDYQAPIMHSAKRLDHKTEHHGSVCRAIDRQRAGSAPPVMEDRAFESAARHPSVHEHSTPSLTSSTFPPAVSSRKRRRYSSDSTGYPPIEAYSSQFAYSPARLPSEQAYYHRPPPQHLPAHHTYDRASCLPLPLRRSASEEIVSGALLNQGLPPEMNEFDLLHGELLESDIDDDDEPVPPSGSTHYQL